MNCQHFKEMSSKLISKEISLLGRLRMYYHMIICPPCKVYLNILKKSNEILKLYFSKKIKPEISLNSKEKNRIKEKLEAALKPIKIFDKI